MVRRIRPFSVPAAAGGWPDSFVEQATARMQEGVSRLGDLWGEIPREWLFPGGDFGHRPQLDQGAVARILGRFAGDAGRFWRVE